MSDSTTTSTRWIGYVAKLAVGGVFGSVYVLSKLARLLRRLLFGQRLPLRGRPVDVVCIGTFYNEGWLHSHARPLLLANSVASVTVITDAPIPGLPEVRFCCPSAKSQRLFGRSLSRLWTAVRVRRSLKNPLFMGYHIMPNGLIALLCASICGGHSAYQMTGGVAQVQGGGVASENKLLRLLGTPSKILESLLHAVIRLVDIVVVRGAQANDYVHNKIGHTTCIVIPGSVNLERFKPNPQVRKDVDLLFVGRLAEVKGADLFVDVAAAVGNTRDSVCANLVGDGAMRINLEQRAAEQMERQPQVDIQFSGRSNDVAPFLQRSRLFALLSRTEGLSIAMLEAMAAGVPVAVNDVGELRSVVEAADCGLVFSTLDTPTIARALAEVLEDQERLERWAANGIAYARAHLSPNAVALSWDAVLGTDQATSTTPKLLSGEA